MPPHPPALHPRSRLTSSLFATTLFASFFVVALPHVLPCPAPRVVYADDGTPRPRRRRRKSVDMNENEKEGEKVQLKQVDVEESEEEAVEVRAGRECPIPKPPGFVGELLGFKKVETGRSSDGKEGRPP